MNLSDEKEYFYGKFISMKRLLCSVFLAASLVGVSAQTTIKNNPKKTVSFKNKKNLEDFKLRLDFNRAKLFTGEWQAGQPSSVSKASNVQPSASIYSKLWGQVEDYSSMKNCFSKQTITSELMLKLFLIY